MGLSAVMILMMVLHIPLIFAQTVNVLCTEEFCKEQTDQFPCKELPEGCRKGSTTVGGIMMPEPSTCNCCDYCLVYLEEGNDCVLNGQGLPVHEAVCGPGLRCMKEDSDFATCAPLVSDCTTEQREYDQAQENGTLGFTQERPLCDEKGNYLPTHCIGGSICYCVNPKGERIFGEQAYSDSSLQKTMTCECSLAAWKAEQFASEMKMYSQPIHCLEDGSYDPLQCSFDRCRCLQAGSNVPDTSHGIGILEINIMEDNPVCFDPNIHQEGKYKRGCEEKAVKIMQEKEFLLSEGILPVGLRIPYCQYDGRYSRVMVTDTEKICVDPDGNSLGYTVQRNDKLSDGMDCNCARTRFLLEREGVTELPTCCANGNFRKKQCRRGLCYCVDCNGNQEGKESKSVQCDGDDDSCSICVKSRQEMKKERSSTISWETLSEEIFQ